MEYSRPKGCPERRAVQGPERYRQRHPANRPTSGWRVPRKGIRAGPAVHVCVRRRGHSTFPAVGEPSVRSRYPRNRHRDRADKTPRLDQGPQGFGTGFLLIPLNQVCVCNALKRRGTRLAGRRRGQGKKDAEAYRRHCRAALRKAEAMSCRDVRAGYKWCMRARNPLRKDTAESRHGRTV